MVSEIIKASNRDIFHINGCNSSYAGNMLNECLRLKGKSGSFIEE